MCLQRSNGEVRVETEDRELSLDQWKLVIDRLARFTPGTIWSGGEIFVYPGIVELLTYAKAKGLFVIVITNGFDLAAMAEKLVGIGVDTVAVSLDGPETVHNSIRRHPLSFAHAVAGITALRVARKARRSRLPCLTINHVIMRENYRHLAELVALARDLGVDIVQFIGLVYLDPVAAQRHSEIVRREFSVVADRLDVLDKDSASGIDTAWLRQQVDTLLDTAPAYPSLRFCPDGLENYLEVHYGQAARLPLPHQRCLAPWRRLVIQPNGDVTVCYFQPELVMGNVLHADLNAIWNGDAFRRFRRRIRSQGLFSACARCGWLAY
jgi:radical SAM protein with 4Fe4S-binding SPASM domain